MPEGDSYARIAERLRPILVDREVVAVEGKPAVRRWAPKLVGNRVAAVRTHGKHLLVDFDGDVSIHVWLGMTGRWIISDLATGRRIVEGETAGPTERGAIGLRLAPTRHAATCLSAPTVEVERRRVIDRVLERLGPDILADVFDHATYLGRADLLPTDAPVADLLLDQRVVAGIGNEYKSEVMFLEGLHPTTPLGSLTPQQRSQLVDRARALMIPNAGGRRPRTTTGRTTPGDRRWVFERTGRPCRACGESIASAHLGTRQNRITYWCPRCQSR